MIGKTLAHYEVTGKLGQGGMGEVYRAYDKKLERDVAIKVLPETFIQDPERLARFEREAKMLASLNHSNIGTIYGLEEVEGKQFLILELVQGENLAERLLRSSLSIDEALNIVLQVAEALESAHERGIVHRDLKPANIQVTPEGKVKVLDFGLAKALEGDVSEGSAPNLSQSPTLSAALSSANVILGTAAYMAPEQARGQAVDKRADIWAFGVVLYEILTGKQLFTGDTVSDTLASVLKTEIDWGELPDEIPAHVKRLLRRCLERDVRRRLRDIGEARILLADVLSGALPDEIQKAALEKKRHVPVALILSVGLVGGILIAGAFAWTMRTSSSELSLRKFQFVFNDTEIGTPGEPAISPDAKMVVYVRGGKLWLRSFDQLEERELDAVDDVQAPFWSPDGNFVGYMASGKIWKTPVSGGTSTTICDVQGNFVGGRGASWGADGTIVYSRGGTGVFAVSARGGTPRSLIEPDTTSEKDTEQDLHEPYLLPDGKGVIFLAHREKFAVDTIFLWSGGSRKLLLQHEGNRLEKPVYSPTGHILYSEIGKNPGIWALPFSLSELEVTGEPFLVAPNSAWPAVGSDGTLVYSRGGGDPVTQLVLVNRRGEVEKVIGQPQKQQPSPDLSPDGSRVAIEATEGDSKDIWIHDVDRGTKTRLTFGSGDEFKPAWSPSGNHVAYFFAEAGCSGIQCFTIAIQAADGTGEPLTISKGLFPSFTPDGKYVVYAMYNGENSGDLWFKPLDSDEDPSPFLQTGANEFWGEVSPDGRYIAYTSNESGQREVYLKRFPSAEGKWQVSVNGGHWPRWNTSGSKLFFVEGEDLMEVQVETQPSLRLSTPGKLFSRIPLGMDLFGGRPPAFDVANDGERFVLIESVEATTESGGIIVVQNWSAEFRENP